MEQKEIIRIASKYPEAFKNMNVDLINQHFSKNATKTGFMYDYDNNQWLDVSTVGIEEIKQWAVSYNQNDIMPAIKTTPDVIDFQKKIAVVKIEMEWATDRMGCDYLFLIKDNETWKIEKIIWQSIL